jgi:hypothetical protein
MVRPSVFAALMIALFGLTPMQAATAEPSGPALSYNRDIRPILSDKCFRCHGPDSASREADLRLDDRASATASRDGHASIVPGDPARSELVRRISTDDADLRMPPSDSELTLSDDERDTLRRWIAQGAKYEPHWAFIAPVRPPLPKPRDSAGLKNPIDHFVRARLEEEKLAPAPEADPVTLCRRLHLDLTGVPPTPAEVDAFVRACSPSSEDGEKAYEALVDKLLASPRFGERMATPWLDAARYADTNGYQSDGPRTMWRWRDWVIEAYNRNLPYDQFTVEQLAGDLLPNPSLDQLIATGFNRNHRINAEGGIIPAEYQVEYVADRAETTATVWLGLTLGCSRCHDHKYDPISQRDYYRLFDYFNRVPEPGKGVRDDNSPPFVRAPTREQAATLANLERKIKAAEQAWQAKLKELPAAEKAWAPKMTRNPSHWTIEEGLTARYRFDGTLVDDVDNETKIDLKKKPSYAGGPFGEAMEFDGRQAVNVAKTLPFDSEKPFSATVWVKPAEAKSQSVYSAVDAEANDGGIELRLIDGRPEVIISNRLLDDAIRIESKVALPAGQWSHVAWTYGGVKFADQVRLFIDGRPVETETKLDLLSNKFKATAELKIGTGEIGGPFTGRIADLRFYNRALPDDEAAIVYCGLSIRALAGRYPDFGDPASALKFREYFLRNDGFTEFGSVRDAVKSIEANRDALQKMMPTSMVMRDQADLRTTHILNRGEYDKPGEPVTAGVPAALPKLPGTTAAADAPQADRLALARWIVDRRNPLTSRVAVNRLWQLFFGIGLVKTSEDFGAQGESPVHPELLEWLAVEFAEGSDTSAGPKTKPWDVKAMIRLFVTSATYRQSSRATPELVARDPENRLLARGARFRLSAEAVRDSALAASGLLTERFGGPSVMPYQPEGLWEELSATSTKYVLSKGDDLYRRSLYTFRKRTIGPPSMMIFDGAGREMCVVRSARTNTPLQALNLLNDTAYVEAAGALAGLMMRDGGSTPAERIDFGFRRVLGRRPNADEQRVLIAGYERRLKEFQSDPKAARALLAHGTSGTTDEKDGGQSAKRTANAKSESAAYAPAELAAYATVANVLLNLDEFVTRE